MTAKRLARHALPVVATSCIVLAVWMGWIGGGGNPSPVGESPEDYMTDAEREAYHDQPQAPLWQRLLVFPVTLVVVVGYFALRERLKDK